MAIDKESKIDGMHWIEKYRPKTLDELVSHEDIITTIEKFINENNMPHLLFHGPPGTGKTSTILACARKLYDEKDMSTMVLELNASDERGINIVRGPIQAFASSKVLFNRRTFKLIILDEADAMTMDAQSALRRSKMIPAIQSRCTKFRFAPLKFDQIKIRLDHIIKEEFIPITEDGKKALIELSEGDMRRVLNILQSCSNAFKIVDEENVYKCCGVPSIIQTNQILEWILNEKFSQIYQKILNLQNEHGYSLTDILKGLHGQISKIEFPEKIKWELFDKMADLEVKLSTGGSEKILLSALIGIFQCARDFQLEKKQTTN